MLQVTWPVFANQSALFQNRYTRWLVTLLFFVGWAISRCLSTTPHPTGGQGGSILLVHDSMIMLKPAILCTMVVVRYSNLKCVYDIDSLILEQILCIGRLIECFCIAHNRYRFSPCYLSQYSSSTPCTEELITWQSLCHQGRGVCTRSHLAGQLSRDNLSSAASVGDRISGHDGLRVSSAWMIVRCGGVVVIGGVSVGPICLHQTAICLGRCGRRGRLKVSVSVETWFRNAFH